MTEPKLTTLPGPSLGNIRDAPNVAPVPGPPVKRARYLDWAGVSLAKLVLYMMAGFVLFMLVYMVLVEQQAQSILGSAFTRFARNAADSSAFKLASHELATYQQGSREFLRGTLSRNFKLRSSDAGRGAGS